MTATNNHGFPGRVSLWGAEVGEEVLLVHHLHQPASHGVYIRAHARQAEPAMLRSRIFDKQGMMIAAELSDGATLESGIEQRFLDTEVQYLHLHFVKPGCYAARVKRG